MITSFPLQLVNTTQQIFPIAGGIDATAQINVIFGTAPTTGDVSIERRAPGSQAWVALAHATVASVLSGSFSARIDGPVGALRVRFTNLSGGADPVLWIDTNATPAGLYSGTAAVTTQPYTEANVKNGVQFYARAAWPTADPIVAGTTRKILFTTGAKPVIIKLRDLQYVSEELSINLYSGPTTVTAGTDVPVRNYNRVNPVASTVTMKVNVTTVSDGTLFDGPEYLFGAVGAPQRSAASIPQGRERVLPANTSFIITITAPAGVGTSRLQYFLDWYEGSPDLPL